MGAGLRASGKLLDSPPDPKVAARDAGHSGGNDLGGEQTRGPEGKRMTAAPKLGSARKSWCGLWWVAEPVAMW